MILTRKWMIGFAAAVLVSVGMSGYTSCVNRKYEKAKAEAETHEKLKVEAEARAQEAIDSKAKLAEENKDLKAKLGVAVANITKPIPKPPVPDTAPEAEQALLHAGLPAKVVLDGGSSLVLADARKALDWHSDALRVPSLLSALKTESDARFACTNFAEGLQRELVVTNTALTETRTANTQANLQVASMSKANKALEAKVSTTAFNGNLKLVVVVPLALYLGYEIGRR